MNKRTFADIVLLIVVFIWGATFVVVQDAIAFLTPFNFNAIRFLIGFSILVLFYFFFTKMKKEHFNRQSLKAGVTLGVWLFLGYAFQTFGLLYTTPGKAGFITGLSVVLVPLLAFLLLKQVLNRNMIIGVVFATLGLYMITLLEGSVFTFGDFLVLLCAVSFAMHIVTTSKYAMEHHAVALTIIQIFTVSVLSLIGSFLHENPKEMFQLEILMQPKVINALLITGILATAFAFLAQTYFQAYTSATRVALIFAMEPVFAAATSYFVIGETFTFTMIIGCLFIFSGIIFSELPIKKNNIEDKVC